MDLDMALASGAPWWIVLSPLCVVYSCDRVGVMWGCGVRVSFVGMRRRRESCSLGGVRMAILLAVLLAVLLAILLAILLAGWPGSSQPFLQAARTSTPHFSAPAFSSSLVVGRCGDGRLSSGPGGICGMAHCIGSSKRRSRHRESWALSFSASKCSVFSQNLNSVIISRHL